MPVETLLAFLLFLLPLAYSPGPGNMFFAAIGARFGLGAIWPANAGYHVATFLVTLLVGLGFGLVLRTEPLLMQIIQYAGGAYILYLAYRFFTAGRYAGEVEPRAAGFMDGVVLLLLNPKGYVIMALIFSQFLAAEADAGWQKIALISAVFTLNNLLAFTLWAVAGDAIGRLFRSDESARYLNAGFALALVGVALWVFMR